MKMKLYHYYNIDDETEEAQFRDFWYPGWGDEVLAYDEDMRRNRAYTRKQREHYKDYYRLCLPDDYYAPGENRRTVNTLRRMIRTYVKEQAEQGRELECREYGSDWLLHKDVLQLIADHLDPSLDELLRQADESRTAHSRFTREHGSVAASLGFGNTFRVFATTCHDEVQDALRLFNLSNNASAEDIKRSYHQLARSHHPDTGGDPEQFKRIAAVPYAARMEEGILKAGGISNEEETTTRHHIHTAHLARGYRPAPSVRTGSARPNCQTGSAKSHSAEGTRGSHCILGRP